MPSLSTPNVRNLGSDPSLTESQKNFLKAQNDHNQATNAALNNALVKGDSLQILMPYTAASPLKVPTDWVLIGGTGGPPFQSGWNAFSGTDDIPRFRKDFAGIVWMEGLITSATVGNNAFTLPAAYQPQYSVNFASAFNTGGTEGHGRIRIIGATQATPGTVGLQGPNPPSTYGSINCSFTGNTRTPFVPSCFPFTANWTASGTPSLVIAQCGDVSNALSPSNLAMLFPDWTYSSGQIQVRNIPGLLPLTNYSVTLLCL